jgi:hypothetical protein
MILFIRFIFFYNVNEALVYDMGGRRLLGGRTRSHAGEPWTWSRHRQGATNAEAASGILSE